jgi:AGZA family xanthine/uracil permease-like MFS transporter
MAVFIIDRKFMYAAFFSLAGAVLTFFGLMHGQNVGFGQTPLVALSYLVVFGILVGCAKFAVTEKVVEEVEEPEMEAKPA